MILDISCVNLTGLRSFHLIPLLSIVKVLKLYLAFSSSIAACAAANLAIGTLNGEQDT